MSASAFGVEHGIAKADSDTKRMAAGAGGAGAAAYGLHRLERKALPKARSAGALGTLKGLVTGDPVKTRRGLKAAGAAQKGIGLAHTGKLAAAATATGLTAAAVGSEVACKKTKSAEVAGPEEVGKSAFGITHDGQVAKGLRQVAEGVVRGAKAEMGGWHDAGAGGAEKAGRQAYRYAVGRAGGQKRVDAAVTAARFAGKHGPAAAAGAAAGAAAVHAAGQPTRDALKVATARNTRLRHIAVGAGVAAGAAGAGAIGVQSQKAAEKRADAKAREAAVNARRRFGST